MKKLFITVLALASLALAACAPKTQEEKVQAQLSSVHPLAADERQLAQTNAKQFFEKEWPVQSDSGVTQVRGYWLECRPSDSNANGLVTCVGKVPQFKGGFSDVKRYCGYRPELVGCSDEDTVK